MEDYNESLIEYINIICKECHFNALYGLKYPPIEGEARVLKYIIEKSFPHWLNGWHSYSQMAKECDGRIVLLCMIAGNFFNIWKLITPATFFPKMPIEEQHKLLTSGFVFISTELKLPPWAR